MTTPTPGKITLKVLVAMWWALVRHWPRITVRDTITALVILRRQRRGDTP